MSVIHFLNVLEGDCNIIQHDTRRVSVIDVSNAYNDIDTEEERRVKASEVRKIMRLRTQVPTDKIDYGQKKTPDNPILYLKKYGISDIFRFIITHPDMDHLDGIQDLYSEFSITNTWDTDNKKSIDADANFAGYNKEDWQFYRKLRNGQVNTTKRLTYFAKNDNLYYNEDNLKILCPTPELLRNANECGNYNDSSYVLLYTPPKSNGGKWKFLFAGDSEDNSWEYILSNHKEDVANVDVLFAPHHGRDSGRSYEFLKTVKPKVTLFGNASSKHLAYSSYAASLRITNNQAGYIIMDISPEKVVLYVKNFEFARNFLHNRGWSEPVYNSKFQAYGIIQYNA
ncbi:MBL fold metallo-hydrolase [Lacibacter luteus]|uniref:MBL fold metallo-hydrolase n=1 Tax=Lacibacter luteus TaxID=2508719 RepID=A0A4Q1CLA0_9BACT|nr:MBL fold metallo-hydrolase [Lacibacter luteus]RXK61777.1 MBL fold metallo-hydrolase [Lacibacter luteus]